MCKCSERFTIQIQGEGGGISYAYSEGINWIPEELSKIRENFLSGSLSEGETKQIIKDVYKNYGILVDPHTAIGIGVVNKVSLQGVTAALATAHPGKFPEVVMEATKVSPELPEDLKNVLNEKEKYDELPKDLKRVQSYILDRV